MPDYFSLFGLPKKFAIDEKELERKYFALQREFHPDKSAGNLGKSIEITNGYRALKDPITRAEILLGDYEEKPSAELLMEMMEIRERLADANAGNINEFEKFAAMEREKSIKNLEKKLTAEELMRLKYLNKIAEEIRVRKKAL